jgi:hypothetical protein
MNAILIIIALAVGFLVAAIIAVVIAGIHQEERQVSLSEDPRTFAQIFARKILDVHISQPDARRILAARHASITGEGSHLFGEAQRLVQSHCGDVVFINGQSDAAFPGCLHDSAGNCHEPSREPGPAITRIGKDLDEPGAVGRIWH